MPRDNGHLRVLIATPYGRGGRGGIDRFNDMVIDAISASAETNITVDRLVTRGHGNIIFAPVFLGLALARLWRAARRQEVDVLHICLSLKGSAYRKSIVARVARHLGIRYVVHLHGGGFEFFWLTAGSRLSRAVDRIFVDGERIVVLGHYWLGIFAGWLPQTKGRVVVFPNATPSSIVDREPSKDGRVRLTFLGELGRRKGTPQLVEALACLRSDQDWTATIAGNGDVDGTRAHVRQLSITDKVETLNWLDPEATTQILRRTDILVLPTFFENLPMTILEAFSFGIPVITTPVGAISEVVDHGRNGLLVPVGEIEPLAEAIRRLIRDADLRQRMGQAAREDHARAYEIGGYVKRLVNLWREVAE